MTTGDTSSTQAEAMVERAQLTQKGMAQFEVLHGPQEQDDSVYCSRCGMDWPCERMTLMLLVQGLAMLQTMVPSGNMGAILSRFAGGR